MNSICVDEWAAERAIIASNEQLPNIAVSMGVIVGRSTSSAHSGMCIMWPVLLEAPNDHRYGPLFPNLKTIQISF